MYVPERDGGEETAGTGQHGPGVHRPGEVVMATVRWMGVPEAEVGMVEGMYEKTTAAVVVGEGASEEFEVIILRMWSAY